VRPAEKLAQSGMQPWLAPYAGWLLELCEANGIKYSINSVYRSRAKQEALYNRWLEGKNKYPVARPGTSRHELGRAMDINTYPDVNDQLGAIWKKMGGFWSPQDWVHFHA
jgi:hypothetical protein